VVLAMHLAKAHTSFLSFFWSDGYTCYSRSLYFALHCEVVSARQDTCFYNDTWELRPSKLFKLFLRGDDGSV
jgi:hypothetical protein